MNEISEIEAKINAEVVFHKPVNDGFIAFTSGHAYVVRKRNGDFDFEKLKRESIEALRVSEVEEYDNTKYTKDEAENKSDKQREYAEIRLSLPRETVTVTVEECPKQVTRRLIDFDFDGKSQN